ncbi:hypothetical protein BsWGS_08303 [Bradybaena similaris]
MSPANFETLTFVSRGCTPASIDKTPGGNRQEPSNQRYLPTDFISNKQCSKRHIYITSLYASWPSHGV